MKLVTIDFETYYAPKKLLGHPDAGYSLKSMMTQEYVCDPRFHAFGAAVKWYGQPAEWIDHDDLSDFFNSHQWDQIGVIGHNLRFDGYVMNRHYGVVPLRYIDTMGMARDVFGLLLPGHGLDEVAKACGLKGKVNKGALDDLAGVRDPSPKQRANLARYGLDDANDTEAVFDFMRPAFPEGEYDMLDLVTRMAAVPQMVLDPEMIDRLITEAEEEQQRVFDEAMEAVPGLTVSKLGSAQQFAPIWEKLVGEEGPKTYKRLKNRKTGEYETQHTYSFSKDNEKFFAQAQKAGDAGRKVYRAKLMKSSNITISRLNRFKRMAEVCPGEFCVPLNYAGVMSAQGRLSGADKLNLQNMSRADEDEEGNAIPNIRFTLRAPEGKALVVGDSSGIEFVVAMTLSGQTDVLERRANGDDEYALMATDIFGKPINKYDNPIERTIGKIAVLLLQYQGGAKTYARSVFDQTSGKTIVPADLAKKVVSTYRTRYDRVSGFWRHLDGVLNQMAAGVERPEIAVPWRIPVEFFSRKEHGVINAGVRLPSGKTIKFYDLRKEIVERVDEETGQTSRRMSFTRINRNNGSKRASIHPGLFMNNLCQSLASEVVNPQLVEIAREFGGFCLQVHDEGVYCVDLARAEECFAFVEEVMTRRVPWWPELAIGCGADYGKIYGMVK